MKLNAEARTTIKVAGITIAAYVRDQMYSEDGRRWGGDECGCRDDRCIGFHHEEWEECGCLPVLLSETVERLLRSSPATMLTELR